MSKLFLPTSEVEHIAWQIVNLVEDEKELEEALQKIREEAREQLKEETLG